ncbi:MAG: T9SS type A sorting domain-containing protein [Cytophagales bacterium]|nr:T9SS type A sorting domain-containing protein [Cytophaga sp.]
MRIKLLFLSLGILLCISGSVTAQIGISPIYSFSNSTHNSNMRTAANAPVQTDTLQIPYIEDFSGPYGPILSIDTVNNIITLTMMKMHGLKAHEKIQLYNIIVANNDTASLYGDKYVGIPDPANKYTFQLFNNPELTDSTLLNNAHELPTALRWKRTPYNGYSTSPDTLGFKYTGANSGGAFIGDGMAINPPSSGVATFDGINYLGVPYYSSLVSVYGFADNLTSLPFNLSSYAATDSVFMSFFWQKQGLGISPSSSDSIVLEFRGSDATWTQVWVKTGDVSYRSDTFYVATVYIKDAKYLFNGFQYRFRNYGLIIGQFDIWNIDYIYIDKAPKSINTITDLTIVSSTPSALINYRAVPYSHFKALSSAQQTAQVNQDPSFTLRNYNYNSNPFSVELSLFTYSNIDDSLKESQEQLNTHKGQKLYTSVGLQTIVDSSKMTKPYVLKQVFSIGNYDGKLNTSSYDFSFNNSKSVETYFYDYYGYDDFGPEYAFRTDLSGIKLANKFKMLVPEHGQIRDSLRYIDICFMQNNGPNLTNFTLFLYVWDKSLNVLATQQVYIKYSSVINGFTRYKLNTPIKIEVDSIYVGYEQLFNDKLFIGYDRNNDFLNNIYYTVSPNSTTWKAMEDITSITGALMIHPVFSNGEILTSIRNPAFSEKHFNIYPNPSNGKLFFSGSPEYIYVYDLSGRIITQQVISEDAEINLQVISNGLYIIHLQKDKYKETHKLLIQHD